MFNAGIVLKLLYNRLSSDIVHPLLVASLPRDAMRKRGLCCRPVSACLSVTLVYCIHTAEDIVKLNSFSAR